MHDKPEPDRHEPGWCEKEQRSQEDESFINGMIDCSNNVRILA